MIKSMTGFGKSVCELNGRKLIIEIRSLNSRQLDLSVKLPGIFREKEISLRTLLSQKLERGKIDLITSSESNGDAPRYSLNKVIAKQYHQELKELQSVLDEEEFPGLLPLVLKMPDVIQSGREEFNENDWDNLLACINGAIEEVDLFRINEGEVLEEEIRSRIQLILELLNSIEPFEKNRTVFMREKLRREFKSLLEGENLSGILDENRFEQELIFYLEKLDFTEEKVRLRKHCDYFIETISSPVSQGKKLGFVTQEIGREINTIGSKANDAVIQKIVVEMKDELEKIKEQLLNIL